MPPRHLIWVGITILAVATVIAGLVAGGHPGYARMERRDQDRSAALSLAHNEVGSFFVSEGRLPSRDEFLLRLYRESNSVGTVSARNWAALREELATGYQATGAETYRLCLAFETDTRAAGAQRPPLNEEAPNFWDHAASQTCYEARLAGYLLEQAAARKTRETQAPLTP